MIGAIAEKVSKEMQRCCKWCVLLQNQGTNSGGDDRLAHWSEEELLVIIYQSVNEQPEEVFNYYAVR